MAQVIGFSTTPNEGGRGGAASLVAGVPQPQHQPENSILIMAQCMLPGYQVHQIKKS